MKKNHASFVIRNATALGLAFTLVQRLSAQTPSAAAGTGAPNPAPELATAGQYTATPGEWDGKGNSPVYYGSTMAPDMAGSARRPHPGSALVLNFEQIDQEKQTQIEQDLRVMSSLLERNLERVFGSMPTIKMGIPMVARGDSRAPQTIYIQGYGAVFLVHVNFPIEGRSEAPKTKEEKPKNSEWESVKQQLYGWPNAGAPAGGLPSGYAQAPEYSAERVAGVEDELIRSLKNASNIRGLGPDEVVVVSVQGTGGDAFGMMGSASGAGAGVGNAALSGAAPAVMADLGGGVGSWSVVETKTFLSLRAKKSDIDAFAAGGLKFDEFKTKVVKAAYHGADRREGGPVPSYNYNYPLAK